MALLFMDGFDHYTTLAQKWSSQSGTWDIGAYGRNGTNGARLTTDFNTYLRRSLTASYATLVAGVAAQITQGTNTNTHVVLAFMDNTTLQTEVRINAATGQLSVTRNGTSLATASVTLDSGAYYYIELKVTFHNTTGAYELRVNGVTVASATGVNTRASSNSSANVLSLGQGTGGSGGLQFAFDDVYLCDTSGSVNNDFLGDCRVSAILPTADGDVSDWTASAGSDYQCVDDNPPNDDTDYISSSTAGQRSCFVYGDLPTTSGAIKGIQYVYRARKDDAGARSAAPFYRAASTNYDATATALADGYETRPKIAEVNPATSAAWTISEINAAQFGVLLSS